MNVLYIDKYPPIEGGTASAAYWRVEALEKQGISFQVVTCITDDNDYRIDNTPYSETVHVLRKKMPWHIPYSQLYAEQLIAKALDIAATVDFDIIEGCYLFPYGFAAYVVAEVLSKPFFLRHAGSDLYRLTGSGSLDPLMRKMAKKAALIVTYPDCMARWHSLGITSKLYLSSRYIPNPAYFTSNGYHRDATFLGKITPKWDRAQFDYYNQYLKNAGYEGHIHVYADLTTVDHFTAYFQDKGYKIIGHPFVMPERVPSILRNTKYLLLSSIPEGIPEESNLFLEGMMSRCTPVCIQKLPVSPQHTDYQGYLQSQLNIYNAVYMAR